MRKKIDNRIRTLIENGVASRQRSMFVVVGDRGRDQVVILHHMLTKALIKARPSVLWCYKKELGFSSHRKKRMRQLQKKIKSGKLDIKEDDPFELFVASTTIRYCYYAETHKILGSTYGMCVLQDFEAMTPNLLARTIETVEGGGIIVILLRSLTSLKQLYTLNMDVHARFRTEAHHDVTGRFNERFILSLASCSTCMVIDDQLNILPISSHVLHIEPLAPKSAEEPLSAEEEQLKELKVSLQDTQPIGVIVNCCKTLDQAKAVLKFVDAIAEKNLRSTAVMTAARGRGKSAALGLAIASAVAFGYSNIFVTAPSAENLKTVFDFVFKGFDALGYEEHIDYDLVQSTNPEFNKAVIRVNIYREHRQTIQYIHPSDHKMLSQAELVCIDEAAAIPLPLVKNLLGPYLVFMSSTINGYEGTGRSLSLKLVQQLRQQSVATVADKKSNSGAAIAGRTLHEVALNDSIRYANNDPVEKWLYGLLCLDVSSVPRLISGCPVPALCDLYYVNRDTLFSYHRASEAFLQRLMSLFVASHYKNTPNDLQMLSDAPAHHIFCLLGPLSADSSQLPEILCALQVSLEGEISKESVMKSLARGQRASGDLIPWTVSQQFQDEDFASLSGGRVVRVATHPEYQRMGYGSRSLELLQLYYEGQLTTLDEHTDVAGETGTEETGADEDGDLLMERPKPRKSLPPLLFKLSERQPERLDYLGVSYGLTPELLRFWKKSGYTPVYLRQTANDLTGEHSCIMLKTLKHSSEDTQTADSAWLQAYWTDFQRRFVNLLSYQFHTFPSSLGLSILNQKQFAAKLQVLSKDALEIFLTKYDVKRLELYSDNMADYHLIMDLLPTVARLYFLRQTDFELSAAQMAIVLGLGLQHKSVDDMEKELELPAGQVLGLFNRSVRKFVQFVRGVLMKAIEQDMVDTGELVKMVPLEQSLDSELTEAAEKEMRKQRSEVQLLAGQDLTQYAVRGSEDDWQQALKTGTDKKMVSIKSVLSGKRKNVDHESTSQERKKTKKHKKFSKT